MQKYCKPRLHKSKDTKIWPLVGLAAVRGIAGGAWRAWRLCRHLDQEGSSKVSVSELWTYFDSLGIGKRKSFNWVKRALKLGLLRLDEKTGNYYPVGLAQAAIILDCKHVGLPAVIQVDAFVKTGWRDHLWSAYLTTTENKLISQATKARLTGVKPRTQYRYQTHLSGSAKRNYSITKLKPGHVDELREEGVTSAFVGRNGKVFLRLPDIRVVPWDVARSMPRGRSRKAQKQVNISFNVERDQTTVDRLFFEEYEGVTSALKKIRKSGRPSGELPDEVFRLSRQYKNTNLWKSYEVAVG